MSKDSLVAWKLANKAKIRESAEAYREANRASINAKARETWKANPDKFSKIKRMSRYGLALGQVEMLLARGKCDCCGTLDPGSSKGWEIDHDHVTGKVRGVLCKACNGKLGRMGDSLEALEANYLRLRDYLKTKSSLNQLLLYSEQLAKVD